MQKEFLQFAPLLIYVLATWDRETAATRAGLLTWLVILGWDMFVLQGDRPAVVKWLYNAIDAGAGWVIVYAHYREPIRKIKIKCLALVVALLR
jgi:hypothetical protein